jgi:hypothetical protein
VAQEISAPVRIEAGRFTFLSYRADSAFARSLADGALRVDSFPGLPRPQAPAMIAIAPDESRFREWTGASAPEWGAAVAFPARSLIVMQGARAGALTGDPRVILRHELAHLALHEYLGDLPPRWFDEGYASFAAGEWKRDDALSANLFVLTRGVPGLDSLDRSFFDTRGPAQAAYALSHLAVRDLASLDRERGLALFFRYWKDDMDVERAIRRAYGLTGSEFEARWKRNVSRRYGAFAIVTDIAIAAGFLLLVFLPLYIRRRRRARERLAAMKAAESVAERTMVTDTLQELLRKPPPDREGG